MANKTSIPKLHSIKFKTGPFVDNVIYPPELKRPENLPVLNILQGAAIQNLTDVVLFGYKQNGDEYCAGSMNNVKIAAYLFGRGQLDMLRHGDPEW